MQIDSVKYEISYPIHKVWEKVYNTRKNIVFRSEKLIEVWKNEEKYETLSYFLEDKSKKITVYMNFKEKKNKTILEIKCEIKSRSIVLDVFSYLRINVKKELDEYIMKVEKELKNEI